MIITPNKRKRGRDDDVLVDFEKCCKVIRNPESWVVERTSEAEDAWLLLADGKVFTTSNAKQRASILKRRHPNKLFCGLRMSSCGSRDADICTFQNGRVDIGYRDNQLGEVALLHDMLDQIMGNDSVPGCTRQGKLLRTPEGKKTASEPMRSKIFERHLGKRASIRRKEEDRLVSAMYHWRNNIAAKAFCSWKTALQQKKLNNGEQPRKIQLGLRNLGNTCYLNAVLQALFSVPSFSEAFTPDAQGSLLNEIKEEASEGTWRSRRKEMLKDISDLKGVSTVSAQSLSIEFKELCRMIVSHKQIRYTPDGILRLVWRLFSNFRGFKQHDAAEILAHLIDRLELEEKSVVQDLFGGKMSQRIEYEIEGKVKTSATSIPFCGPWGVEIPEQYRQVGRQRKATLSCSIHDCIAESTISEPISDYELPDGSRIDATKRILFESLPQVLMLHINRTAWGVNASQKVQTMVEFPMALSLGQYRVDGKEFNYKLCSIVSHHGHQMSSGHFTAYGRRLGAWHHFNDAKVTAVSEEEVLEAQPYILIYELMS